MAIVNTQSCQASMLVFGNFPYTFIWGFHPSTSLHSSFYSQCLVRVQKLILPYWTLTLLSSACVCFGVMRVGPLACFNTLYKSDQLHCMSLFGQESSWPSIFCQSISKCNELCMCVSVRITITEEKKQEETKAHRAALVYLGPLPFPFIPPL